jgi:hypothetical protein
MLVPTQQGHLHGKVQGERLAHAGTLRGTPAWQPGCAKAPQESRQRSCGAGRGGREWGGSESGVGMWMGMGGEVRVRVVFLFRPFYSN